MLAALFAAQIRRVFLMQKNGDPPRRQLAQGDFATVQDPDDMFYNSSRPFPNGGILFLHSHTRSLQLEEDEKQHHRRHSKKKVLNNLKEYPFFVIPPMQQQTLQRMNVSAIDCVSYRLCQLVGRDGAWVAAIIL